MTSLLKSGKSVLSRLYHKAVKNLSSKSSVDVLHNKTVLYVAFLVSIVNLILWMIAGDIMNVVVFALVGFLTAFFSKNMIVILVFALVVSNIIKYGIAIGQEGFEEGETTNEQDPELNQGEATEGIDEEAEGLTEGNDEEEQGLTKGIDEQEGLTEGIKKKKRRKNNKKNDPDEESPAESPVEYPAESSAETTEESPAESTLDSILDDSMEGMQTLQYSNFNSMLDEQNKLFSNISKMAPFVVNVDNEAKLRTSLKYENFKTNGQK